MRPVNLAARAFNATPAQVCAAEFEPGASRDAGARWIALARQARRAGRGALLALLLGSVATVANAGSAQSKTKSSLSARGQSKATPKAKAGRAKSTSTPRGSTRGVAEGIPPKKEIPAELRALGPLSVGHPSAGFLFNSVRLPPSEHWLVTAPDHAFATAETIDALSHCLTKVHTQFPSADPTPIGSLSAERGGKISPHKSHRTGRDADVYFFRKPGAKWIRAATETDLEREPTWALLRCFVTETDVDMILIDRRVQGWLEAYALSIGEDREWVRSLFHDDKATRRLSVVRHEPGHVAHMHVRFASPKARRAGASAYDRLVAEGLVIPKVQALAHRVKKGETLSGIAHRYGVTVSKIRELNRLQSNLIRVGQELTLQRAVDILGARDPVGVAQRRLPPREPNRSIVVGSVPTNTAEQATQDAEQATRNTPKLSVPAVDGPERAPTAPAVRGAPKLPEPTSPSNSGTSEPTQTSARSRRQS